MTNTRSPICTACDSECVTMSVVSSPAAIASRVSLITCSALRGSRAAVCSSRSRSIGSDHGRHQDRERLALSAGQQPDRRVQSVLKTHTETSHGFAQCATVIASQRPSEQSPAASFSREDEVLGDAQLRGGTSKRALEYPADKAGPPLLRPAGHILIVQLILPRVSSRLPAIALSKLDFPSHSCRARRQTFPAGAPRSTLVQSARTSLGVPGERR